MSPLRSFFDVDGKERGQKKTDDLRAMTTLGPRTLPYLIVFDYSESSFLSFFLIVLARSNFDHYASECDFGILKKKNKKNLSVVFLTKCGVP